MASSVIHLCIANEINKVIKHDSKSILIGSIAPDLSKELGMSKGVSHFQFGNQENIPQIDKFIEKYQKRLTDDFVLGYYIHLYTDYLWFKYFIPEFLKDITITKLDGTKLICHNNELTEYIYNDYTNINNELINKYQLPLDIFYDEVPEFANIIKEIPMDKLYLIVNKTKYIIDTAKKSKSYIFDIEQVNSFISTSVSLILANLQELNITIYK